MVLIAISSHDIESATKTGSDGEKNLVKIQRHQIALMVFMILLTKVRQDSIYFYQQLKDLQAEYEAYKETLDLRWSNPNRDQELEKANAKFVETQQNKLK